MNRQRGFFDEQNRLDMLSRQGDLSEKHNAIVDGEMFPSPLK
jgi:hypothetical protein